jgi:hypothetical protein
MPFRRHLPSFFPGTFITTPEPMPHPGQHPRQGATPLAHTASYSQPYCCDAAATASSPHVFTRQGRGFRHPGGTPRPSFTRYPHSRLMHARLNVARMFNEHGSVEFRAVA